ncbi:MAG: peptidase S10 [Bryobacteraceae bacterium]|nr:peptidase S10 [Bryobacteraceae bacterium]
MLPHLLVLTALAGCRGAAQVPAPKAEEKPAVRPEKTVTREHTIAVGTRSLAYTSTAGFLPLHNDKNEPEAHIFYTAYVLKDAPQGRPVTFCFNGGPGSGSLWLHLGAIGPRRVPMNDDGSMPPPPYRLADNPDTWLDQSDLVFIDPVGTGYSRPKSAEVGKKYFSLRGDIESVGTFIRQWLTANGRWGAPLFLAGESYGTTRAAGLAGHLVEKGISFNGIFLISTILNFQTARFARGNDLPYALFLPTYTAIAHYHKRLPADLQASLEKAIGEARRYASDEYQRVLYQGDALTTQDRKRAAAQLARLTGLDAAFIERSELRIEIQRFCKELLRDQGVTVGRLDGRLISADEGGNAAERPEFDPSLAAIRPPYTSAMNQYARQELGFETELEYFALGGGITSPWDFNLTGTGGAGQGYADTSVALRDALAKNPYMKVFVASGYYDLATPFEAALYTVNHMGLEPATRNNFRFAEYPAGHMMYIHVPSLRKLKHDVDAFYAFALARSRR